MKAAAVCAEPALDDATQFERSALEYRRCGQRDGGARVTQERKRLVVEQRALIERHASRVHERAEQSIRAAIANREVIDPPPNELECISAPAEAARLGKSMDLPGMNARAAR